MKERKKEKKKKKERKKENGMFEQKTDIKILVI